MAINERRVDEVIALLERAKAEGNSATAQALKEGHSKTKAYGLYRDLRDMQEKDGIVLGEKERYFWDLYDELKTQSRQPAREKEAAHNTEEQKKAYVEYRRDSEGYIYEYFFWIPRRDQDPLTGTFSRLEMESLVCPYSFQSVTQQKLAREFKRYMVEDIGRILRAFGIRKQTKWPKHMTEEYDPEELNEALENYRVRYAENIYQNQKTRNLARENRELRQRVEAFEEETHDLTHGLRELFSEGAANAVRLPQPLRQSGQTQFVCFADWHMGKYSESSNPSMDRGNNKDVLRERMLQIGQYAIQAVQHSTTPIQDICFFSLGDVIETLIPDGMHAEHYKDQDLYGPEQIQHAYEALRDMLVHVYQETALPIRFYSIGGNHDRIQDHRQQDRDRTGAILLFYMLEQFFEYNNADVDIRHCRDQYMSVVEDGINFIAFHGDNALYKRKPVELVNEFRTGDTSNYVVVLSGHVHQFKMRGSAKNFMDITLGSVCSPDHFTRDQLGFSTTPSCMIGKKSPYWGFDFTVINLY